MEMRFKEIFSKFNHANLVSDIQKIKENHPTLWNKLKNRFDTGRQIVSVQLNNGLERINDQTLRLYLHDYANRFLKYGPI
jgi:hypothetical protein